MIFIEKQALKNFLIKNAGLLMLAVLLAIPASAQDRTESGQTPLGIQKGSPAGSYSLSGFESVNPYSGGLNFTLPLLQIGGRGNANFTVVLKNETKWAVMRTGVANGLNNITYIPTPNPWNSTDPGYGPGIMVGRVTGVPPIPTFNGCPADMDALTRLTFIRPDGSEFEFRDAKFEGQQKTNTFTFTQPNACHNDFTENRGKVFVTRDGSSATFISDGDIFDYYFGDGQALVPNLSGHMFLADGTCYRIINGLVDFIRDRNGNKITFLYSGNRVSQITDALKRTVDFTYSSTEDTITYKGFGGTSRVIKIHKTQLGSALRPGFTLKTPQVLFPDLNGADSQNNSNPDVIENVEMPDGRFYKFLYNSYAELARVELPTGGGFEYDWDAGRASGSVGGTINAKQIYRRIIERRVCTSFSGTVTVEGKMTYSRPESGTGGTYANLGYVIVDHLTPGDVLLSREKHYYDGRGASPTLFDPPSGYPAWKDGKETRTDLFDTNGTTILQTTKNTFDQSSPSWWTGTSDTAPSNNTVLLEARTELPQTNPTQTLINKQQFAYDQYNNQTDAWEYDFGVGSPGTTLLRHSKTQYLTSGYNTIGGNITNPNVATTIHIRNLPTSQAVYSDVGTANKVSETTYEYDNYNQVTSDIFHDALTPCASITSHDSNYTTNFFKRGNATKVSRWLNTGGTINTYQQYDIAGNVIKTLDPRSTAPVTNLIATTIDFTDRFGIPDNEAQNNVQGAGAIELTGGLKTFAFATKVTNALGHTAYTQFDYYLGKPVNGEDANGVVTSGRYAAWSDGSHIDKLDRVSEVETAAHLSTTSGLRARTRYAYDDANKIITTTSDHTVYDDPNPLKSDERYDGLGRTVESRQYEPGGFIKTLQEYDAMGRARRSHNPHRAITEATYGYTDTTYDGMSRVKTVKTYDRGATLTGTVTSDYNGRNTTVTDQAGKKRRSVVDGVGRLIRVDEPDLSSATGALDDASGNPLQSTSYGYDTLGNLKLVTQGTQQTRTFTYDSLSRLLTAQNPEQVSGGTQIPTSYTYDAASNLTQKVNPNLTSLAFEYDKLNRAFKKTLSTDGISTSKIWNYTYDTGVSNPIGRLVKVVLQGSNDGAYYDGYDALGRLLTSCQITTAGSEQSYETSYAYNLAGELTSQTYPSGKEVRTSYDTAGRITGVSRYNSNIFDKTYASAFTYTPHGAVSALSLGGTVASPVMQETMFYNSRLQPTMIELRKVSGNDLMLRLDYLYGATGQNNGNISQQVIRIGGHPSLVQNYTYDSLNRLKSAVETGTWTQTYDYDRFGNRAVRVGSSMPTPALTPTSTAGGDLSAVINAATNRISVSGYSYDESGNLKSDPSTAANAMLYDSENKQTSYTKGGVATTYSYDADGRRVKKTQGSAMTVFVYNAMGQMIAEYQSDPVTPEAGGGTSFLTTDALGSTRLVTGASGQVKSRRDYLPFGEEISSVIAWGVRNSIPGYSATDGQRNRFTSKERDDESGMDYFIARYYSGAQGRFTSPDEFAGGPDEFWVLGSGDSQAQALPYASLTEPQSLNKYQYCYNNPLRYTDIDGNGPSDWLDTVRGAVSAWGEANGATRIPGGQTSGGRAVGQIAAIAQGLAEIAQGIGLIGGGLTETVVTSPAAGTGVGAVIPAAGLGVAVIGGAEVVHGGIVIINAVRDIRRTRQDRMEEPSPEKEKELLTPKESKGKQQKKDRNTPEGIENQVEGATKAKNAHQNKPNATPVDSINKTMQDESTFYRKKYTSSQAVLDTTKPLSEILKKKN
jgi:RHS repeat-associated protein